MTAVFVGQDRSGSGTYMPSANGALSLLSLGQSPRNLVDPFASAESAAQKRRWSVGGGVTRHSARLIRAFRACGDFCVIPGAMPQADVEAAPSALNRYLGKSGSIYAGKPSQKNRGWQGLSELKRAAGALMLLLALASCGDRSKAVSGTIEVDEAHVGPRAGGRVEKIFHWEGEHLKEGELILQLDASELHARRDLASAQINTALHDADAQQAQLVFLRDEAKRQQDLLTRKVVSSSDAERAQSSANTQEKNVAAAQMRVAQARAQLADIDAQLAEMQVMAPADSILEVLSVKVGDVLPANREAATLILTGHLWVRVYVPESWLGLIKLGEQVRVRVDSFPGKDFDGVVEQINRQAEFTPRNVQTVADRIKQVFGVKVRLPADDDHLRAGMAADVYFPNVK